MGCRNDKKGHVKGVIHLKHGGKNLPLQANAYLVVQQFLS